MIHNIQNVQEKLLSELFDNKKTGSLGGERDRLNLFSHNNRNSTQTCPNQRREFNDSQNFKVQGYLGSWVQRLKGCFSLSSLSSSPLCFPPRCHFSWFLHLGPSLSGSCSPCCQHSQERESYFPLSSNPSHLLTLIGQNWLTQLTEPITLSQGDGISWLTRPVSFALLWSRGHGSVPFNHKDRDWLMTISP